MSDGGKGSNPRPFSVDDKTFNDNWNNIFKKENKMSEDKTTPCGCGRSPTGQCIGWHSLTNEEYKIKLQDKNLTESTQLLKE